MKPRITRTCIASLFLAAGLAQAAWINNPFEVNMDGRICAQDFALMSSAYEPE